MYISGTGISGTGSKGFQVNSQRYTYRVLQNIQMKLILLCVWAEQAVVDSAKTALKFKYELNICFRVTPWTVTSVKVGWINDWDSPEVH